MSHQTTRHHSTSRRSTRRSKPASLQIALFSSIAFGLLTSASLGSSKAAELKTIPADPISIETVRSGQTIRSIVVQSETKLNNLKIVPTDLVHKGGKDAFSAQWITTGTESYAEVKPNEPLSVALRFDIVRAKSSGDFSGMVLLQHEGGEKKIPIQLRIKDDSWWPTLFLIAGVLAAFAIAWYQAEGVERDEILFQLGRIKLQLQADPETPISFRDSMKRAEVNLETALQERRLKNARQQISQIQTLWDRWRQWRSDWLRQIDYQQTSLNGFIQQSFDPNTTYGRELKAGLEQLTYQMASYETPEDWRKQLIVIRSQISFYHKVIQELQTLNEQWGAVSAQREDIKAWELRQIELLDRLDELNPNDLEPKEALKSAIVSERQAVLEQQALSGQDSRVTLASPDSNLVPSVVPALESPPALTSMASTPVVKAPRRNVLISRWAGRGVGIFILAGAGFQQLYLSNPTFGAGGVGDYLTLLMWGFGAEVTRDSVSKAMKKLKLPGFVEE